MCRIFLLTLLVIITPLHTAALFRTLIDHDLPAAAITALSWEPFFGLTSASSDGFVRTWDTQKNCPLNTYKITYPDNKSMMDQLSHLVFLRQKLAGGFAGGVLAIATFNVETVSYKFEPLQLDECYSAISCLSTASMLQRWAAASEDQLIIFWDNVRIKKKLPGTIRAIAWSQDNEAIACSLNGGGLSIFDLVKKESFFAGTSVTIDGLSWLNDKILICQTRNRIELWDIHSMNPIDIITNTDLTITTLSSSPDQAFLVIGFSCGIIKIVEVASKKELYFGFYREKDALSEGDIGKIRQFATMPITTLCWSPDGEELATGYENGIIALWSMGKIKKIFAQTPVPLKVPPPAVVSLKVMQSPRETERGIRRTPRNRSNSQIRQRTLSVVAAPSTAHPASPAELARSREPVEGPPPPQARHSLFCCFTAES